MTKPSPWGGEPAELAPCPFCGDRLHLKVCHDSHHGLGGPQRYHEARVDCPACQVSGPERCVEDTPNIDGKREAELRAIAAWNRRTPSQSPYPPDRGGTHWEGCWRERGHHNCAVAEIERLCIALGERES